MASWWHLSTTLVALAITASVAVAAEPLGLRLLGSLLTGLTLVRVFIVYHDYQHQAMLKDSRLASAHPDSIRLYHADATERLEAIARPPSSPQFKTIWCEHRLVSDHDDRQLSQPPRHGKQLEYRIAT